MVNDEQIAKVVGGAAVTTGVLGLLFARTTLRLFGVRGAGGELAFMTRFASVGNVALGVNLLTAEPERQRKLLVLAAVTDGLDCLLAIGAGLSGGLSKRTAALLALSTGSVAALAGLPLLSSSTET